MSQNIIVINKKIRKSTGSYAKFQTIYGLGVISYILVVSFYLMIFVGLKEVSINEHNYMNYTFQDILFLGFYGKVALTVFIVWYLYKFYLKTTEKSFEEKVKIFLVEAVTIPFSIAVFAGYGFIFLIANRTQIIELDLFGFSSVAIVLILGIAFGLYHQTWTFRVIINTIKKVLLYIIPRITFLFLFLFLIASVEFFSGYSFVKNIYSSKSGILYDTYTEESNGFFNFSKEIYIKNSDGSVNYDKSIPYPLNKDSAKEIVFSSKLYLLESNKGYIFIRPQIITWFWGYYKTFSTSMSSINIDDIEVEMYKPSDVFFVLGISAIFLFLLLLSFYGIPIQQGLLAIPHYPVYVFKLLRSKFKKKRSLT